MQGDDFGGTWYWNRYPGAQCDTASLVYLPLLEETGYRPTEKYAHAPEIFTHCRRIGQHYRLYDDVHFNSAVISASWTQDDAVWTVATSRGITFTSRFLIFALGQFHAPRRPLIEGWDNYRGHVFHTACWDYDYTGGNESGAAMEKLADKRVGIIGTGATAVQCIPHLARASQELFVFQRTPPAVDVRNNEPIHPEWFQSIGTEGWQKHWIENFLSARDPESSGRDLVQDGWTSIAQNVRAKLADLPENGRTQAVIDKIKQQCDFENMNAIRQRVDAVVHDEATADQLKPWYFQFCKRPCFHDDYLKAFNNRATVLVDTKGKGIDCISSQGVIAAGVEYKLDCIIIATGFTGTALSLLNNELAVTGRNGRNLGNVWAEGMKSLHGIHVHGFPNAFHVQPTQGANFLSNISHNLIESADTISAVICHAFRQGARVVEADASAQAAWVDLLKSGRHRLASDACTPGNFNNEGHLDDPAFQLNVGHPAGPAAFFHLIKAWREDGLFSGLSLSG